MARSSLTHHTSVARTRHAFRPRHDALEDRRLLTAGLLDTTTFNPPNGYVLTGFTSKGSTDGYANDVDVQPDGKIIAAGGANGSFAIARYNPNGSLDSAFGSGGKVLTAFSKRFVFAMDTVLQADGKIVAAGWAEGDFAIARYNPNGSLDTSFGPNHDGKVLTDFDGSTDQPHSIVIQPDGKIVVAGSAKNGPAIVRYNSNGSLDMGFGTGGIVSFSRSAGFRDVELETFLVDGVPTTMIVAAGWVDINGSAANTILARVNLDGSPDPTFGTSGDGVVIFSAMAGFSALDLAIRPDGYIIAAGFVRTSDTLNRDIGVARFDTSGTLDTTFNSSGMNPGIATVGTAALHEDGRAVVLNPTDGKIILGGSQWGSSSPHDSVVARLNPDGTLDTSFGSGGLVVQSFSTNSDSVSGVALQADGKIVTAGRAVAKITKTYTYENFVVARFLGDPPPASTSATATSLGSTSPTEAETSLAVTLDRAISEEMVALLLTDPDDPFGLFPRPKRRRPQAPIRIVPSLVLDLGIDLATG